MRKMPLIRKHDKRPYPKISQSVSKRQLIQQEAKVGAALFGDVGPNRSREFFMLDRHTWVWHEEWTDEKGFHRLTTRYEIHNEHVLKKQNDLPAVWVEGQELTNLYHAIQAYYYAVTEKVYNSPAQQQ